ncbi:uncharacterized protein LOC127724026 [Mytilus californianus]|uniref:uncharacterized protein LOC127724026 n=1 Tax=Mytilus californianus TaxID=6549 RepID=UPI0022457A30|nr:uncharacterized protein LOC127724026 [Mytilus californianus]
MHRAKRTHRYLPDTGDPDSDDYYNSDKDERVYYSYPQRRRLIRFVPTRTASEQRDDRIIKRYSVRQKEPERVRIMYPSSHIVRRTNYETESETRSSSDYYRDNTNYKVHVIRSKPTGRRNNTTSNLLKKEELETNSYSSPSFRFIRRVNSGSESETESSTDKSDSTQTKARIERSKMKTTRFSNSSPRRVITYHIIEDPSIRKTDRNEASKLVSSKNRMVDRVIVKPDNLVKRKQETLPRTVIPGGHKQGHNLTHQTKLAINNNDGVTFLRPYSEVRRKNEIIDNRRAVKDIQQSFPNKTKWEGSLESDSYTSSYENSESDSSDGYTTDSSEIQQNDRYNTHSTRSTQTECLLVDYSKVVKSREEQRIYEQERRRHAQERHIVSLVQTEVNKPRFSSNITGDSCITATIENKTKPLPSNTKGTSTLDELEKTYDIKEKVSIDMERKERDERRNQLEVWAKPELSFDNRETILNNNKQDPLVYNLDNCRNNSNTITDQQDEAPDNIDVKIYYDEDFESMYPKPRKKGCQLVYYIDLRPPTEIVKPKPFDVFERHIVPQKKHKKRYADYAVKVGGGWNTMNDYMERHEPVIRFVYEREHLKNSDLPEKKKKYYGFRSTYKSPRYNRAHRTI